MAPRSPITTHVLDTASGRPASGVPVVLEKQEGTAWAVLGQGTTNDDGRIADLLPAGSRLVTGVYRMRFDTGTYFAQTGTGGFYPLVDVVFHVQDTDVHYHIPLLLSPFGYSTYRGS